MGPFAGLLFLLGCSKMYAEKLPPNRPHIVLMVADDLGWNDVSFHGSKQVPTPNIDAVARDGIILNQNYVQPLCSPSRGSLMTGKYSMRLGLQHGVILAGTSLALPLTERILPQYLKALKYSTHAVGKWHLGFSNKKYLPQERGFDSFFGYYNGVEDYFTHTSLSKSERMDGLDLHENDRNVWHYNGTYGTDLFTAKAKKVILDHDSRKPLFLYFAQQAPHSGNFIKPLQAPKKYVEPMVGIGDEKRKIFAGMLSAMDHSVGEIFATLEQSGMLDNTIFIFSSDNGGVPQGEKGTSGSNWPLKGGKYTVWEGGVRAASFIWSPFLRRSSRIHNGLMHISDWLPTILSMAGGPQALRMLPRDIDGVDQWPSIVQGSSSPRTEILLNIDDIDNVEAIRKGRYKLVKGRALNGRLDKWFDKEGRIFNVTYSLNILAQGDLYHRNYLWFLKRSEAARVLQYKYGRDPLLAMSCPSPDCKEQLEIKCGAPPRFGPTCNSEKETCLYDIIRDPCEYYNIAQKLPWVTFDLKRAIDKYRPRLVPFRNYPEEPEADPKLHGNAWVPWK